MKVKTISKVPGRPAEDTASGQTFWWPWDAGSWGTGPFGQLGMGIWEQSLVRVSAQR